MNEAQSSIAESDPKKPLFDSTLKIEDFRLPSLWDGPTALSVLLFPNGGTRLIAYDAEGNLTGILDAGGKNTQMAYDGQGHVTMVEDHLTNKTYFTYDGNGALATVTDPEDRLTRMIRDSLSRVTRNIDGKGKRTDFAYDPAGDLTKVTDHLGGVTTYDYEKGRQGRLLKKVVDAERQPSGPGTTFGYDPIGRLTSVTNALGQTKTFGYDAKGNLTAADNLADAFGAITFTYDALDRLDTKVLPEGTVDYDYDANGNLKFVDHPNGSRVDMSYDELDRVSAVTNRLPDFTSYALSYTYDKNGNRKTMSTPWGSFSYAYDALNRLTSLTNPDGRLIAFDYDALGRRTLMSYPNDTQTIYSYDNASQLIAMDLTKISNGTPLNSLSYAYDPAGNRTSLTDGTGTHSYSYDDLHRLTGADHPDQSAAPTKHELFDYDKVGNRNFDAHITNYQYDAANRLLSNSSFTYQYDGSGNQSRKTKVATGKVTDYIYNSENLLIEVKENSASIARYKYDGLGRRVEKSTGPIASPSSVRHVYDNEDILAMLDGQNNLIALFTHGPGIDEPLIMKQADGEEYFFHADGLGSIIGLTDATGSMVERVAYDAYGLPKFMDLGGALLEGDRSFTANPYAFTGREWDASSGLYFYRARYYDPRMGRFWQEDPIGFTGGDVNLFTYVSNRPTFATDPEGTRILVAPFVRDPIFKFTRRVEGSKEIKKRIEEKIGPAPEDSFGRHFTASSELTEEYGPWWTRTLVLGSEFGGLIFTDLYSKYVAGIEQPFPSFSLADLFFNEVGIYTAENSKRGCPLP